MRRLFNIALALSGWLLGIALIVGRGSTLSVAPIYPQVGGFLIANLPACTASNSGQRRLITNSKNAPSFTGGVGAAGGTNRLVLFCNGTAWIQG